MTDALTRVYEQMDDEIGRGDIGVMKRVLKKQPTNNNAARMGYGKKPKRMANAAVEEGIERAVLRRMIPWESAGKIASQIAGQPIDDHEAALDIIVADDGIGKQVIDHVREAWDGSKRKYSVAYLNDSNKVVSEIVEAMHEGDAKSMVTGTVVSCHEVGDKKPASNEEGPVGMSLGDGNPVSFAFPQRMSLGYEGNPVGPIDARKLMGSGASQFELYDADGSYAGDCTFSLDHGWSYQRMSAGDWAQSKGPRGGTIWTNKSTGRVVRGKENPGDGSGSSSSGATKVKGGKSPKEVTPDQKAAIDREIAFIKRQPHSANLNASQMEFRLGDSWHNSEKLRNAFGGKMKDYKAAVSQHLSEPAGGEADSGGKDNPLMTPPIAFATP